MIGRPSLLVGNPEKSPGEGWNPRADDERTADSKNDTASLEDTASRQRTGSVGRDCR